MNPRRQLATAILGGIAGAGLALYAATRVWWTETVPRRDPLPPKLTDHTGADLAAWIVPLAIVALAGAVALYATRGAPRKVLAAVLALAGLAVTVGGVLGIVREPGLWPIATTLGGLAVTAIAALALRESARWPHMSNRYERTTTGTTATTAVPDDPVDLWNALDRGEDPTSLNIGKMAPGEGSSG
ncbi:Trp biosynthesis-associated membrane protein [Phytomonospora sp. NPDC050363]|uniref:Trp biosynthesis-associated membrane protein n=1 Tax=Phytomonospora sp. NPDC050363 TaxID=3155642 RepID=UPI0034021A80